jgi:hypothetical protein
VFDAFLSYENKLSQLPLPRLAAKAASSGKAANRYKGAIFIGEVLIVFDESAF